MKDVKAGDLWYLPEGIPHSIQGLGPEGCEFLLVFDEGKFSEEDTTACMYLANPRNLKVKLAV